MLDNVQRKVNYSNNTTWWILRRLVNSFIIGSPFKFELGTILTLLRVSNCATDDAFSQRHDPLHA